MSNVGGRPQKPAALKLLQGNPGRRPVSLPDFNPQVLLPDPPKFLSTAARAEWERLGPVLERHGLISDADVAAFALYCQAYGRWQQAEDKLRELEEKGRLVVHSPNGYPQQHAWLAIANRAMDQVASYLQQFGLSPSSRARVTPSSQLSLSLVPGDSAEDAGGSKYFR